MRKHILGLAIFSFVVFAAAFVYGIFNRTAIGIDPIYIAPTYDVPVRETKQPKSVLPNVAQAVYSVRTKKLTWQGNLPNERNMTHFDLWAADGKKFNYLGAMRVKDKKRGNVVASNDLSLSLNKIAPSVNLYLIAEADDHFAEQNFDSVLEFDARNAVPITIDYGE